MFSYVGKGENRSTISVYVRFGIMVSIMYYGTALSNPKYENAVLHYLYFSCTTSAPVHYSTLILYSVIAQYLRTT